MFHFIKRLWPKQQLGSLTSPEVFQVSCSNSCQDYSPIHTLFNNNSQKECFIIHSNLLRSVCLQQFWNETMVESVTILNRLIKSKYSRCPFSQIHKIVACNIFWNHLSNFWPTDNCDHVLEFQILCVTLAESTRNLTLKP